MHLRPALGLSLGIGLLASACDAASGPGALTVFLQPETTITDGIAAGSAADTIVDGWTVSFSKYVVALGDVRIARSSDGQELLYPTVNVVDLRGLATTGFTVVDEPSMPSGRWDLVSYGLLAPDANAVRDPSVTMTDFDAMVAGGCTYLIEGTLTNAAGQSCPPGQSCRTATSLAFRLCEPATVSFTDCTPETGLPGLVVSEASTSTVAFTLHGDHLFFSTFPAGTEIVSRRAQWLADADMDANDLVDDADLLAVDTPSELSALYPSPEYSLANAPGGAIDTARDYAIAKLRTQGHFQGEGECAVMVTP